MGSRIELFDINFGAFVIIYCIYSNGRVVCYKGEGVGKENI